MIIHSSSSFLSRVEEKLDLLGEVARSPANSFCPEKRDFFFLETAAFTIFLPSKGSYKEWIRLKGADSGGEPLNVPIGLHPSVQDVLLRVHRLAPTEFRTNNIMS